MRYEIAKNFLAVHRGCHQGRTLRSNFRQKDDS